MDILDAHTNPPAPNGIEQAAEAVVDALLEGAQASENAGAAGTRLNFMAESELDNDTVSFENGAEWVEKEDASQAPQQTVLNVEVEAIGVPAEAAVSGLPFPLPQTNLHALQAGDNSGTGALNWAEDEGELPSIDGLHAAFGTSGQTTPQTSQPAESVKQPEISQAASTKGPVQPSSQVIDEDGFTQASRGGRARGRGRGHFQRGGPSGQRGPPRGGERGGYRGASDHSRRALNASAGHILTIIAGGRGKPSDGHWRGGGDGDHRRGRGPREHRGGRPTGPGHERGQQAD